MLREFKDGFEHYSEDEQCRKQGEYKSWYDNKQLYESYIYVNGERHGEYKKWHENGHLWYHCFFAKNIVHSEYKSWWSNGRMQGHCFYLGGEQFSFDVIPYPATPEELMLFKLKYDLRLLP